MAQLVALAGEEEGPALEARAAARFLQEWIQEHGVSEDDCISNNEGETEDDRAHHCIVALHTVEEAATFPPTRRALGGGGGPSTVRPPNAHMVSLTGYVLRSITRLSSATGPTPLTESALVALKAMTALQAAWRLEAPSSSAASLVAALHRRHAAVVPALIQASVALLCSPALPYEVKNQAGLVLLLAALDSADAATSDAAALAGALAACFFPPSTSSTTDHSNSSSSSTSALLAPLHPSLRGLPTALAPLLHASSISSSSSSSNSSNSSMASEAGLALTRAVLVATDLPILTAALPPTLPREYDASIAAGGTLMGGACVDIHMPVSHVNVMSSHSLFLKLKLNHPETQTYHTRPHPRLAARGVPVPASSVPPPGLHGPRGMARPRPRLRPPPLPLLFVLLHHQHRPGAGAAPRPPRGCQPPALELGDEQQERCALYYC